MPRPIALLLLLALSPAWGQDRFEAPFFFGLASAPGQSEDALPDIWRDWADQGKVAAYKNQAVPERRLEFWTKPEVELDMNWRFPERIRGRVDFFGMNYYGAEWIRGGRLVLEPDEEYSEAGRAVSPTGLYTMLKEVHRRFPDLPIIITENGIADATDILRPAYLLEHLAAVAQARREGVPVSGYIFWTLSDNLEWGDGYCPKFGLVAVDRAHGLKRIPRPSYDLFRRIAATREITSAMRDEAWVSVAAHALERARRPEGLRGGLAVPALISVRAVKSRAVFLSSPRPCSPRPPRPVTAGTSTTSPSASRRSRSACGFSGLSTRPRA